MEDIAEPMNESAWSKKYKQEMKDKIEKADTVLKAVPDNKIANYIKKSSNRELSKEEEKPDAKTWEFVQAAYHATRDIYMDGEATLDEALKEFCDALEVCRMMATEKGESGKTKNPRGDAAKENKKLAEEIGS